MDGEVELLVRLLTHVAVPRKRPQMGVHWLLLLALTPQRR